jgi:hypothetical protein
MASAQRPDAGGFILSFAKGTDNGTERGNFCLARCDGLDARLSIPCCAVMHDRIRSYCVRLIPTAEAADRRL